MKVKTKVICFVDGIRYRLHEIPEVKRFNVSDSCAKCAGYEKLELCGALESCGAWFYWKKTKKQDESL